MINTQEVAMFKSQKDYVRNKQKLSEYIRYTQMWQVLSVIFSYAAFTCDIILVIPKDDVSHAYGIYNYKHK